MRNIMMKIQNRSKKNSKNCNNLNKLNISSLFLVILMLCTVVAFTVGLYAQENNNEAKQAVAQEFIKMAQEFEKKDQIDEAIEIYKRITIAFPEDINSQKELAKLYTRSKLHEKAAEIWIKLLDTEPENRSYQDELFKCFQNAGKIDEALELAQTYIQTDPEVGVHYARLAKLQTAQGRDDVAITNYKKAVEYGHADKETYLKLAELYFIDDDIDATENALKKAIIHTQSEWDREKIERQLINLYRYQENLAQRLQQADEDGTITFELQKALARHFLNNNEFEKAANSFKKALEMTNSSYSRNRVVEELLKVYLKQDRTDLALEFYETDASKQPRLRTIVTSYGSSGINITLSGDHARKTLINAHKDQGNLDALKTLFESKQEKDDDNPNIIEMLAKIYWENNDYKRAAESYHLLSKVEPNNVHSFYFAAAAFHKSNQPDMVKVVLNQANNALRSSNKNRDESFLGALATICLNNEMYEPAKKLADDAVTEAVKSDNSWELEYLYQILGKSYLGTKRYEDAYQTYQKMADTSDSSYMRDEAETEMDKIAKTANLYEKWIPEQLKKVEENPNDTKLILKLAQSYEKTNKFANAVEQYEKLSTLEPENVQWHKKLGNLYKNLPVVIRETGDSIEGTALTLGGNGSYVEMADSESLDNITDQVTVSAWIKPTEFPNNYIRIVFRSDEQRQNYRQRSYILAIRSDGKLKIASSPKDEGYASVYSPPGLIKLNTWTHIAGVIDAKKDYMKLFINGYESGHRHFNGEDRFVKCNLPLRIGVTHIKDQVQNTSFIGQIDEVRVWNIPRTEAEIRADMNKQLNGDEHGLVGYWTFDAEIDGNIFDASPNKNDGTLIGNAKLESYTRKIFKSSKSEHLDKSITAYQTAIEFEPISFQNYNELAKLYIRKGMTSDAEAIYRRALDAPMTQSNHDSAIREISKLYADKGQDHKHIAVLEEIKPLMENSAILHEHLGDLYSKVGDADKAKIAYNEWLQIRQKALNNTENARSYRYFAEALLKKGLFPETALKYAKRAFQRNTASNSDYSALLGHTYIANGQFDDALNYYLHGISIISSKSSLDNFWDGIRDAIKYTEDKDSYYQMLEAMMNSIPSKNIRNRAFAYRLLTQYYSKNDKAMNVEKYLFSKTGFVPETRWLTLGPFNNIDTMGHRNAFIPEETTQIDTTAKYYGKHGLINWKKSEYIQLDGHYNFGDNKDWSAAYVWAIVISPDEQDITFRFDSDDQGTIWLNGKQVFSHDRTGRISFDRYSIPVTLKQGENTILIKVCNAKETWGFYLRLTDSIGNPIKDLKFKTADELLNVPPPKPTFNVMSVLGMAEYYSKNNEPKKAMEQIQQTGIIHENVWMTLGPFDNSAGIGYNTAYISEDTVPIDINEKYESANGQIGWKQFTDGAFNGYIDLGRNLNWKVSYALATVTSPDEREVQLRFGSDDQAKVWLNGKEVYANPQYRWAVIDDNIIPVTLNAGKNTVLVKVCNEELGWGFYVRITDVDGKPLDNLKIGNAQNQ